MGGTRQLGFAGLHAKAKPLKIKQTGLVWVGSEVAKALQCLWLLILLLVAAVAA